MKKEQISCAVAQDLMPLVIDEVCSQDSKDAVEQHMAYCKSCAQHFQEMKKEMPVRKADEKAATSFQRSLRRLFHRFRRWQIISIVLAAILAAVCLFVTANPQILNGVRTKVPLSWMQNPTLVRTEQNALLLRFTPSENYRHFYYGSSCLGMQTDDGYEYRLSYDCTLLAKLFPRDISEEWYRESYHDSHILMLDNGDWAIPLPYGGNAYWRYENGEIAVLTLENLTQEDIVSLLESGVAVDGNTGIYKSTPMYHGDGTLSLYLSGPDGEKLIYQSGDEIPLCDQETQDAFNRQIVPIQHEPGDVVYHLQG